MNVIGKYFIINGIFNFLLYYVISPMSLENNLLHCQILLLTKASSALLMMLDSAKIVNFILFCILQPLGMTFS